MGDETMVAAMTIPVETSARTFGVFLGNMARVQGSLEALAKRCERKGLPALVWSWGKAITAREHVARDFGCVGPACDGCRMVSRVPLSLLCEAPRYAGWTFVAALEHLGEENIVRGMPGADVPLAYRTQGPACDHCHTSRRRTETYVLRHDDGRTVQVGSTCIADFLGSDDAGKLAAEASMLAMARGLAEGGCDGEGFGGSSGDWTLADYLPFVAWSVRVEGWLSRTVARERDTAATADRAWMYLTSRLAREKASADLTTDDGTLAAEAEAWAEGLSDAAVDGERGDYLHNVRAVARTGIVGHKSLGLAASMVTAYQRAMGRERAKAERAARPACNAHLGTVGKRETFAQVVLDFVTGYEGAYGYTTVLKFRTAEGATLVWKASSTDLARGDVGKRYSVTGTVKRHAEYKGEKQTEINRCKVVEIVSDARRD